jgi:acyl transferase domain-containing protein
MATDTFSASSPSFVQEQDKLEPIAIVGIGCRFPDDATSPEKFWEMLMQKHSARRDIPPERFNIDSFYHPEPDRNGTVCSMSLASGADWLIMY